MVSAEATDGEVLLRFQGRRGSTANTLPIAEAEAPVEELEAAIATVREQQD
jgi:hypothetical protein